MRFFTDDFFSEQQKAALAGSEYLKAARVPLHQGKPSIPVSQEPVCDMAQRDEPLAVTGLREFERTSRNVEFIFLGAILGFYVAAALLDMLARSHVLSA